MLKRWVLLMAQVHKNVVITGKYLDPAETICAHNILHFEKGASLTQVPKRVKVNQPTFSGSFQHKKSSALTFVSFFLKNIKQ